MQEIALAGLQRGGFFDQAAFYGGTCLRIFHGLPRFSEDLDFSLLAPSAEFSLEPYFRALQDEFSALGVEVSIAAKKKVNDSAVESAFLKEATGRYSLQVRGMRPIKIKVEVDTDPPLAFQTEEKLLLQPYSFYVKCFSLPDLFAGKMHALLFRRWRNRVKGRDWYDFEWYVRHGHPVSLEHFAARATQSGDLSQPRISADELQRLLSERIESVDFESAKEDIARFVPDQRVLDIWSRDYFHQLCSHLKTQ
ncbi:nucleotidyl transferase AbiEii/AbiGii toxin family protein [Natronospirillum operosum]|uniref:Nucleotidyl transferase AbiEii/AbiGii toxin family protein n=2 Tax=Natronospirillum operosum TaxID=2759953 RepID=A0A4Z0WHL8_9GAMM|nr:nucleotidyl transferase AbiEii/AbiGii toxin family protein [Natronospirillum operosum]